MRIIIEVTSEEPITEYSRQSNMHTAGSAEEEHGIIRDAVGKAVQ